MTIIHAPHLRAEVQRRLLDEIADEDRRYWTKWGFAVGTHEYNSFALDIAEIRATEDHRATPRWPRVRPSNSD